MRLSAPTGHRLNGSSAGKSWSFGLLVYVFFPTTRRFRLRTAFAGLWSVSPGKAAGNAETGSGGGAGGRTSQSMLITLVSQPGHCSRVRRRSRRKSWPRTATIVRTSSRSGPEQDLAAFNPWVASLTCDVAAPAAVERMAKVCPLIYRWLNRDDRAQVCSRQRPQGCTADCRPQRWLVRLRPAWRCRTLP